MLRIPLIVSKNVISLVKPQKTMKQEKDKRYHLSDVMHESQKKYRESKNIVIDPKFIIEEEEKRQPLSFQE